MLASRNLFRLAPACALIGLLFFAPAGAGSLSTAAPAYVQDEVLVTFRDGAPQARRSALAAGRGLLRKSGHANPHFVVLKIPPAQRATGATVASVIAGLRRDDAVRSAEPNYVFRLAREPNEAVSGWLSSQWGLFRIEAPQAWDTRTDASGVTVAVIDTGVDYNHPDLQANILRDGSGNLVGHDYANSDPDPMDDNGHGTFCAGIIGAVGDNATGVVGVSWRVRIMPLKAFNSSGTATVASLVNCLDFARTNGAKIINASWGGPDHVVALQDAVQRTRSSGVLFVSAAGNNGGNNDTTPFYPANYNQQSDNVLAVAASTETDTLASFSNYGATTVDLAAPGTGILSTVPGGGYANGSGTSAAAPFVSGAAALVLAHNAAFTYREVRSTLFSSVDSLSALAGRVRTGGRLNLRRALEGAATDPTTSYTLAVSPTTVSNGGSITVSWTAPTGHSASDWIGLFKKGDPDTAYLTWFYTGAATSGSQPVAAPSSAGEYEFRTFLNNGWTRAATSSTVTVTAPTQSGNYSLSGAPTTVTAGGSLTVSWTAPSGHSASDWIGLFRKGDPDTAYLTWFYTGAATSGSQPVTAPGTPGEYEFRLFLNNGWTRAAVSNTVTVTAPTETGNYTVAASPATVNVGGSVTIAWTAPSGHAASDWIGLFRKGDPNTAYGAWFFTGGATSGSQQVTAPATPGEYEFRYLLNRGYTSAATSNTVTVR